MGTVYRVEDTSENRVFAVKEADALDDPRDRSISREDAVAALVREGRTLSSLDLEGIPKGFLLTNPYVHTRWCAACGNPVEEKIATCPTCQHPDGSIYHRPVQIEARHYLFMDFIAGENLETRAARQHRPLQVDALQDVQRLLHRVALVLQGLHQRGLVHRDVKPENIRIDQAGTPFLLDFGLVAETGGGSPRGGTNYGSEGYAPEEQATQSAHPSQDVYALAMTLLAVTTGQDPSDPGVRLQFLRADEQTLARDLIPGLPPHLANLIIGSLAKTPQHRPAMSAWVTALDPTLPPPPVQAPVSVAGRSAGKAGRRIALALLAVAVLVLVLPLMISGKKGETYEVRARAGAMIFQDYRDPRDGSRLQGGETLKVRAEDDYSGDNWLRVVRVDGTRSKGYIKRSRVDVIGEGE